MTETAAGTDPGVAAAERGALGRGALLLTASSFAFLLSGYVTNVWLGRHLGPVDYGLYGVVVTFVAAVNVMQVYGVPQALSRRVAEDPASEVGALRTAIRVQMTLTVALTALLVVLAVPVAVALGDHRLTDYVRVGALILPAYGLYAVYGGYHNGRRRFGRQAGMVGLYALGKTVLVLALAASFGLVGALLGFVFAPLVAIAVGAVRARAARPVPARGMIALSVPLVVYSALATLQLSVDLLLLKGLDHIGADAGYYAAAQNMAVIPYYAVTAAAQVLFPTVTRHLAAGDVRGAAQTVTEALRLALLLLLPGVVMVVVSRHGLVDLLYSARYAPAATAAAVLVVGYAALALFSLFGFVLNGAGRTTLAAVCAGAGVAVSAVVCSVLIPDHRLVGAAIGSAAGAATALALAAGAVARIVRFRLPVAPLLRAAVGAAVTGLVVAGLDLRPRLLPLSYVAAGAAYLLVLLLAREPLLLQGIARVRQHGRRTATQGELS